MSAIDRLSWVVLGLAIISAAVTIVAVIAIEGRKAALRARDERAISRCEGTGRLPFMLVPQRDGTTKGICPSCRQEVALNTDYAQDRNYIAEHEGLSASL